MWTVEGHGLNPDSAVSCGDRLGLSSADGCDSTRVRAFANRGPHSALGAPRRSDASRFARQSRMLQPRHPVTGRTIFDTAFSPTCGQSASSTSWSPTPTPRPRTGVTSNSHVNARYGRLDLVRLTSWREVSRPQPGSRCCASRWRSAMYVVIRYSVGKLMSDCSYCWMGVSRLGWQGCDALS